MLLNINKNEMIGLLSKCLNAIGFPPPGPIKEAVRMWWRAGVSVSILEPGVDAFEGLIKLVEKEGRIDGRAISDVFSRRYIEAKIQELISGLAVTAAESRQKPSEVNADQIRKALDEWVRGFEIPSEVATYYTVVGNLILEAPIQVGTVTLSPFNEKVREALLSDCSRVIDLMADPEDVKGQFKQHIAKAFQVGQRRVLAYATVSEAEPHRAEDMFRERVREVLHVLRFFGYFIYPSTHRAFVDFVGHVYSSQNNYLRLVPDTEISWTSQRAGVLFPYELTGKRLKDLQKIGLLVIGDILSKQEDERTRLENSCINAITWISRALKDDVADSRFLKLCIAMESLLLRGGDAPYGKTMAERVAFLLGRDLQGRQEVDGDVKKVYSVRSKIAHEGRSRDLEKLMGMAEFYATNTVLRFMQLMREQDWNSRDDFISWLDNLKFA